MIPSKVDLLVAEVQSKRLPWYDLGRFIIFQDLLMVLGGASIVTGIALWTIPGGCIALGVGLIALSWLLGKQ